MAAFVSVIMPCFNAGPMLRPALRSVLTQSHPDIEVIFVDNNSTDGSAEVARDVLAKADPPFTLVSCPEQGVNRARNLGYTHARGDFIQWMDADDGMNRDKQSRRRGQDRR
jgi:glycosyltransferase involved in cell wall biosynthesis